MSYKFTLSLIHSCEEILFNFRNISSSHCLNHVHLPKNPCMISGPHYQCILKPILFKYMKTEFGHYHMQYLKVFECREAVLYSWDILFRSFVCRPYLRVQREIMSIIFSGTSINLLSLPSNLLLELRTATCQSLHGDTPYAFCGICTKLWVRTRFY